MDRGAWWAIVHMSKESDATERLLLTQPTRMANLEEEWDTDSTKYWDAEN